MHRRGDAWGDRADPLDNSLIDMRCEENTTAFAASTVGLESGSTHTLIAMLADNGHAPLMNAMPATTEITVG